MMLELEVDRAFRCGKFDLVDVLNCRDIIDLGDVLPDEGIEELLSQVVSSSMPSLGMNFTERMELLCLRLLFCSALLQSRIPLGIVLDTQMDTHERSNTANGWKVVDGRCTRKDPFVAG